jgi:hypothetical protein
MKKTIFIVAFFIGTISLKAQNTTQVQSHKNQMYYSFFWGLFKSTNYQQDKTPRPKNEKLKVPIFFSDVNVDTTKYEQKRLLWGTVEWTEKKKNITSVNK